MDDPNDAVKQLPQGASRWRLIKSPASGATRLHFTGQATFDDCFEVVFDPATGPAAWLERRKVPGLGAQVIYRCDPIAGTFLRALVRGLLGNRGNVGVGDVDGCAREQFGDLLAAMVFTHRGGRVECRCQPGDLDHAVGVWQTTSYYKGSAWAHHTGPQATLGAAMRHASAPWMSVTKPGGPIAAIIEAAAQADEKNAEIINAAIASGLLERPRQPGFGMPSRAEVEQAPMTRLRLKREAVTAGAPCYICSRRPVAEAGQACEGCRAEHLTPEAN